MHKGQKTQEMIVAASLARQLGLLCMLKEGSFTSATVTIDGDTDICTRKHVQLASNGLAMSATNHATLLACRLDLHDHCP